MKIGFTLLPQPGKYNPDLMLTFEKGKLEAFSFIERKGYISWEGIGCFLHLGDTQERVVNLAHSYRELILERRINQCRHRKPE